MVSSTPSLFKREKTISIVWEIKQYFQHLYSFWISGNATKMVILWPSTENASFTTAVYVNILAPFGVFVCLTSLNSTTTYKLAHKRLTDVRVHTRRNKKCTKPFTLSQLICFNVANKQRAHLLFFHCEFFLTLWDPWIAAYPLFLHIWNSCWTFRSTL